MSRTFASLAFWNYRLWFFGALTSNIGTWAVRTAQAWMVLTELTDNDAVAVGNVLALQFAPTLVLSLYAGVVADRLDQRRWLMVTQMMQAAVSLAIGLLALSGHMRLSHMYVLALAFGVATAFDAPARQSFVSEMVPRESLANAVALNATSFNTARLIGPLVAGWVYAAFGSGWVFTLNAITYAASLAALAAMRSAELIPRQRAPRGAALAQIGEGIGYVLSHKRILLTMLVVGSIAMMALNFQLTNATMAREVFERDTRSYATLNTMFALGSLPGALLAARRRTPSIQLVLIAALGFGVAETVAALAPTYEIFMAALVVVGLCTPTMLNTANASVQMAADPAVRGRVMSLYMMLMMGTSPFGSLIVGYVSEAWGARWGLGVGAVTCFVVAPVAMLALRSRGMSLRLPAGSSAR